MRKIELDELKQLQLQILDEVVDFCNQHQIKYFLMAGTLLGAVRHQGYIPWDDDIDIGMLREDYEHFLELYSKKQGDYYIYTHRLNPKSTFPFIKVCLKNTLVEEEFLSTNEKYGVNIDIFPIDNISSSKTIIDINFWLRLRHYKASTYSSLLKMNKKFIRVSFKIISSLISFSFIFNKIDNILQQNEKTTTTLKGNAIWGYGLCELTASNVFDEMIEVIFENKLYHAPKKYNEWLGNVYGNYMELPPENQRVSRHSITAYHI